MKWVTRENAAVDRVACPWLINRFIDPEAEFIYVNKDEVLEVVSTAKFWKGLVRGQRLARRGGPQQPFGDLLTPSAGQG
jgi:hypothetical protein